MRSTPMRGSPLRRAIAGWFLLTVVVTAGTAEAQRSQLPVDWSDNNTSGALESFERDMARTPRPKSLPTSRQLSLPRWGFGIDLVRPNANERARSLSSTTSTTEIAWPSCAAAVPKVGEAEGDTRDWYSDDYDWGCISINIMGDRNYDPRLRTEITTSASDCEVKNGRSTTAVTPSLQFDRGSFVLHLRLNGIPYTINGSCLRGAEAFCTNRAAQCALVERLILKGGAPQ